MKVWIVEVGTTHEGGSVVSVHAGVVSAGNAAIKQRCLERPEIAETARGDSETAWDYTYDHAKDRMVWIHKSTYVAVQGWEVA